MICGDLRINIDRKAAAFRSVASCRPCLDIAIIAGTPVNIKFGQNAVACGVGDELQRLFDNLVFRSLGLVQAACFRLLLGFGAKVDQAGEKIVLFKIDQHNRRGQTA